MGEMLDENKNGIPDLIENPATSPGAYAPGATTPNPSGDGSGTGPKTKVVDGYVFQWVPGDGILTEGSWERVGAAKDPSTAGGGAGRNDALDAAQAALAGFLQAQSLADARKMAAMENFMKLSKFALPPGATHAPGYEPGGAAHTLAARQGLAEYRPPAITPRQVNPNDVAGDIPPEVRQMLGAVRAAGGG